MRSPQTTFAGLIASAALMFIATAYDPSDASAATCPSGASDAAMARARGAIMDHRAGAQISERALRQAQGATAIVQTARGERGSGVNVSSQGLVLTALHLVKGQREVLVTLGQGGCYRGQVVSEDASRGLALISIEANAPLKAVSLRQAAAQPGEAVYTLGSSRRPKATPFAIHAGRVRRSGAHSKLVAYDAWTDYGYGGGPVVDARGDLLAMHTAWDPDSGMRLGVASSEIHAWLRAWRSEAKRASPEASRPAVAATPRPKLSAAHQAQLVKELSQLDGRSGWSEHELEVAAAISAVHGASVKVGGGSGVNLAPSGLILTAYHVVDHDVKGGHGVLLSDGRTLGARVIAYDAKQDLALLKVEGRHNDLPFAPLAKAQPKIGQRVIIVGHPAKESGRAYWNTSAGKVLGYVPMQGTRGDFAYDAWTYWGHSGSPVFNELGQVVGIHNSWDPSNAWRHGLSHQRVMSFLREAKVVR